MDIKEDSQAPRFLHGGTFNSFLSHFRPAKSFFPHPKTWSFVETEARYDFYITHVHGCKRYLAFLKQRCCSCVPLMATLSTWTNKRVRLQAFHSAAAKYVKALHANFTATSHMSPQRFPATRTRFNPCLQCKLPRTKIKFTMVLNVCVKRMKFSQGYAG